MSATHWFLVLNGKSAGDDALRAAVATMRDRGLRIDVRVTWEDGDAARIVGSAVVATLHTNPAFQQQLQKAKDEFAKQQK